MNRALFRHGTSDAAIWHNVLDLNEYRLSDQFSPGSLVLDVGGNTGAFTYACIQRGAAKVIAFEPDPDNFNIFRKQLKAEIADGRVEVYPLAVVGGSGFSWRTFSGVVQKDGEINHGGAFLFSQAEGDYGLGQYIVNRPFRVPCIGFDEIEYEGQLDLALLKCDAEGAEWEIFPESLGVGGFKRLVGEYHGHKKNHHFLLSQKLSGFNWEFVPHPDSDMGLFFADRK